LTPSGHPGTKHNSMLWLNTRQDAPADQHQLASPRHTHDGSREQPTAHQMTAAAVMLLPSEAAGKCTSCCSLPAVSCVCFSQLRAMSTSDDFVCMQVLQDLSCRHLGRDVLAGCIHGLQHNLSILWLLVRIVQCLQQTSTGAACQGYRCTLLRGSGIAHLLHASGSVRFVSGITTLLRPTML